MPLQELTSSHLPDWLNQSHLDDPEMCAIVFVQRRYAACVLNKLINEHVENSKVKSDFVTGHGSQMWASTETGMNYKKQKEKLKEFRSGSLNVLVGTSVIEEGVDIPQCNLVVMFDFPQDYRAYIQSRGRGRAKDAKYVMLVESSKLEEKKQNLEVGIEYNSCARFLRLGLPFIAISMARSHGRSLFYSHTKII